mmetsp:Transcript_56901/g.116462  ORF Transcript_56901/g.116462 Transcript_56901/m.116462 type:complete len:306 (-) Transcript_56901:6-923(-)
MQRGRSSPQDMQPAQQKAPRLKDLRKAPPPPPSRWKSKKFKKEEFDVFLARQAEHVNVTNRRTPDGQLLQKLQKAPLLPINGMVYQIHGGLYIDSAVRNKSSPQLGDVKKRSKSVDTASFRAFLHRQSDLLQTRENRCRSADLRLRKKQLENEKLEEFLKRQEEFLQAREERNLEEERIHIEMSKSCHPPLQDPEFLKRNGPRSAPRFFEKAVEKAKWKWKQDVQYDVGESPLFKKKLVLPQEVDTFWGRMKEFPSVANREPPPTISKPESGFRLSGNPYVGGKADVLMHRLGEKSGILPRATAV